MCNRIKGILIGCVITLLIAVPKFGVSQTCGSCDYSYHANTSSPINVTSGVTCIDAGVTCSGAVSMEGGTLCNNGIISNLMLSASSGTIYNSGSIFCNVEDIMIMSDLVIVNNPGATLKFTETPIQNLNINIMSGEFHILSYEGATVSIENQINLIAGTFSVGVGIPATGTLSGTASVFNVESVNINNAQFMLSVLSSGVFNCSGSMNLNDEQNKTITNYGQLNIYSNLNIGGAGAGANVLLQNFGLAFINSNLTANGSEYLLSVFNYTNASFDSYFEISGSLNQAIGSSTITNNSNFSTGSIFKSAGKIKNNNSLNISTTFSNGLGSVLNTGNITVNSMTNATSATFTNAALGTITTGTFINSGSSVAGKESKFFSNTFVNNTSGSYSGPSLTATEISNKKHAKILITNSSTNNGSLSGYLNIYDITLVASGANAGTGFDNVGGSSSISGNVGFASYSNGSSVLKDCSLFNAQSWLDVSIPASTYCPFGTIYPTIYCQLFLGPYPLNNNLATTSYTALPGPITSSVSYIVVNPTVTTIYTVSTIYEGCSFSKTVEVLVCEVPIPSISYSTVPFSPSTGASFSVAQTGLGGGSYYISPSCSGITINSSTGLISASGNSCFTTFTVTYCTPNVTCCESACFTTTIALENLDCDITYTPSIHLCPEDKFVITPTGGFGTMYWSPAPTTPTAGLSCTACPSPTLTFDGTPTSYTVVAYRAGRQCGTKVIPVALKEQCQKDEIIGCCFSNYGAAVWLNNAETYINVHCNLLNELGFVTAVEKGEFENRDGSVRVLLDWIHNGKNNLYTVHQGTTSLFGNDQKIKGVSITQYNELWLEGNGTKTLWIDSKVFDDLDFKTNQLALQNNNLLMKNEQAQVIRTTGYASDKMYGYFSWVMPVATSTINQKYLYPMGSQASSAAPFRYRPVVMSNNATNAGDEISVNFMNMPQSQSTDMVFVNTNSTIANNVNNQAPNVLQINHAFYHKIKQTTSSINNADLVIKAYYVPVDGQFQSISEWEKSGTQIGDWWGSTPGSSMSTIASTDAGTSGMIYAMSNGTLNFNHKAFALARGGFYLNTSNFGTSAGNNTGANIVLTATAVGAGNAPNGGGLNNSFGTGGNSGNNGNGGNTVFAPSPVTGDYVMTINPGNSCEIGGRVRFVIDQNGNIEANSVKYGPAGTGSYYGNLSPDVYSIDNVNTGLTFSATPKALLKACVNSITVTTSFFADHLLTTGENILVTLPSVSNPSTSINYGQFKIYNKANQLVWSSAAALTGSGTQTLSPNPALSPDVYRFELAVIAATAPPVTEVLQGQLIVK